MSSERHIQLLPDHVANKIAAGEVVDRPASVVKELVENALDAGATQVDVQIVAGGRKLISVSDNGSGMNRDDALLSVERHATSKIRDVDDIERIGTLGFRGEALAAISAVAQFTLTTRRRDAESGTEVVIHGGKMQDVRDAGCPVGTTIHVRHLFFNVPARRKFLRSEQTELSHVRQAFLVYALSHPSVGFRLTVDEREVYRLAAGASVEDRLRDLFGPDLVKALRPVDYHAHDVTLRGYAGLPAASRADRAEQYIFINTRPASAPLLNYAVGEAYHTLLPHGRHPVLFLYVELDPSLVDVNVHPAKKEVRFRSPGDVRDAVIAGIRESLERASPNPELSSTASRTSGAAIGAEPPPARKPLITIENLPPARTFSYPRMPMIPSESPATSAGSRSDGGRAVDKDRGQSPWAWCRILGQVGGLYVVLETDEGLVLMDPHAAHERILFEKYMSEVLANKVTSQGLLTPETVDLAPRDALRVRENVSLLRKMGFGISEFGGDSFIVDALPACLGQSSAAALLTAVSASLEEAGARGGTERWSEESIAQAACKTAVKARDRLNLDEIERLVVDLAGAEMPYTCPHGRPTIIFMSFNELHKKFGRT